MLLRLRVGLFQWKFSPLPRGRRQNAIGVRVGTSTGKEVLVK